MEQDESLQIGRAGQEALIRQVPIMRDVAKKIKQVEELPSEIPTDEHSLIKVDFPTTGGILTYMEGYDYPYKGYPYYEFVEKIDLIKKLTRAMQSGFYHALKQNKFKRLLIPLIPSLGRSIFWACTFTFYRLIDRFKMRVDKHCTFVNELYRAFSVVHTYESEQVQQLRKMLRDIECMILEMDNAYRFRAQDLLPELNKEALRKKPIKELERILDIWIEREINVEVQDSWRLLKMVIKYYLRYDPELLNIFVQVLLELDIEKCKLSVEDKYYCIPRKDYHFGFAQNPTPEDAELIKNVQDRTKKEEERTKIKKQSTVEHDALRAKQKKEQAKIAFEPVIIDTIEREQALLDQKFALIQSENEKRYKAEKDKAAEKYFTPEQKEMFERHALELEALDKKFEELLQQ